MISAIRGILEGKGTQGAFIRVGGITFHVLLPGSSLSALGPMGKEVHLFTHLQVREDGLTLYGFTTMEELGLFQNLISVSGVGPKLALALLSALSPNQLVLAIASGDSALLRQVPGIGKLTAQRLVLELKDKIERIGVVVPAGVGGEGEVVSVLTNLGYTLAEASKAVHSLPNDRPLSLEDKIKLALQSLSSR